MNSPGLVRKMPSEKALVIDLGTYDMLHGASGADVLRVRTLVGVDGDRVPFIGGRREVARGKGVLIDEINPAPEGFSEMDNVTEKLWAYAFEQQGWKSHEHPVMLTIPARMPRAALELLVQTWFEIFNVPALYCLPSPYAVLYGTGKMQGVVLDVGEAATTSSPVSNGTLLKYAIHREPLGGRTVTQYFKEYLNKLSPDFATDHHAIVTKEAVARCCPSYSDAINGKIYSIEKNSIERDLNLTLPDGNELSLSLGKERLLAGEVLFRPSFDPHLLDNIPVHQVLWNSIQALPTSMAKDLVQNVIVAGGTSQMDGFTARLTSEVDCISSLQLKPRVITPRDRTELAWKGASLACSLAQFEELWITKEQYNDAGPSVVHKGLS
eukprot:TRINITY_DN11092_c0_g1_i1.p1 TRINITY_DN11092_c0_g1~~TRINITY_DN11092_c0_g1_i1.p1  ORF type:complete len:381 (+),score=45.30 TRINITY_DN11092_c0_g1_i1:141-1283(+)